MRKYVCVLATNNYLNGCLILNENLKHINSKYELLCLINEDITKETRDILDCYHNGEWIKMVDILYGNEIEDDD